jgi:AraC-like DNA-binding protein
MDHRGLHREALRTWAAGGSRLYQLGDGHSLSIGLEDRRPGEQYDWHGLRRGGDAQRPYVVLQYTLAGWGHYEDARGRRTVEPGQLMAAVVPSDSRYWLPSSTSHWEFLWVIVSQPHAVALLQRGCASAGAVLPAPADGLLALGLLRLFTAIRHGNFADPLAAEQAVVELGFAFVRRCAELTPADDERSKLRSQVRDHLQAHPGRFIDVAEVAAQAGMSRSAFSHRFARVAGTSPARYALEVRLDQVRQALVDSDAPLAEIAADVGFADANHLCKVFKRAMHLTPGAYRRQMRGG